MSSSRDTTKLIAAWEEALTCPLERSSPWRALRVRETAELHYKQCSSFSEDIKRNKEENNNNKQKKSTVCCYQEPLKKREKGWGYVPLHQECWIPTHKVLLKKSSLLNKNVIENKRELISLGKTALQDMLVKQKREKNAEDAVSYWSKIWRLCMVQLALQQGAFYLIYILKNYVYWYTFFYMRIF